MDTHPFIAIEGPIGVGKTTLARLLGETLPGQVLLEVFEENPFLGDFYADRERYAFQTQLFFLLSRYHQQHSVVGATIAREMLVSDYLFAKDWLFAHLNLRGDELAMYERVHAILGEQIPTPDLVVYLKAPTDTLMERIAFRDRPYERQMERSYIHALQLAYEEFFADYTASPVLPLDTEQRDIVRDQEARNMVIGQVKNALEATTYQPLLPEMDSIITMRNARARGPRLADLQRLDQVRQPAPAAPTGIYYDYITLTAQMGALGQCLARMWQNQERLFGEKGSRHDAREQALAATKVELQATLGAAFGQILRMANDAGIDLEGAYLQQALRQR